MAGPLAPRCRRLRTLLGRVSRRGHEEPSGGAGALPELSGRPPTGDGAILWGFERLVGAHEDLAEFDSPMPRRKTTPRSYSWAILNPESAMTISAAMSNSYGGDTRYLVATATAAAAMRVPEPRLTARIARGLLSHTRARAARST
jgi:hypothetical protein